MENEEKNEKLICVLNKNIDKVRFDGEDFRFIKDNVEIKFILAFERVTEKTIVVKNYLGYKHKKVVEKTKTIQVGRLISFVNGFRYDSNVNIDKLNEFKKNYNDFHNNFFEKKINKLCDGKE